MHAYLCDCYEERVDLEVDLEENFGKISSLDVLVQQHTYLQTKESDEHWVHMQYVQDTINSSMYVTLIDWLADLCIECNTGLKCLFYSSYYITAYLGKEKIAREQLQLLGCAAILIASKIDEYTAVRIEQLLHFSAQTYTEVELLGMERAILKVLEWKVMPTISYDFLCLWSRIALSSMRCFKLNIEYRIKAINLAKYITTLSLQDYDIIKNYAPSKITAAAILLALYTISGKFHWNDTMKAYTGYNSDDLMSCAADLWKLHLTPIRKGKYGTIRAIYDIFCTNERAEVAKIRPLDIFNKCKSGNTL